MIILPKQLTSFMEILKNRRLKIHPAIEVSNLIVQFKKEMNYQTTAVHKENLAKGFLHLVIAIFLKEIT